MMVMYFIIMVTEPLQYETSIMNVVDDTDSGIDSGNSTDDEPDLSDTSDISEWTFTSDTLYQKTSGYLDNIVETTAFNPSDTWFQIAISMEYNLIRNLGVSFNAIRYTQKDDNYTADLIPLEACSLTMFPEDLRNTAFQLGLTMNYMCLNLTNFELEGFNAVNDFSYFEIVG